jgi:hypothetical protein
MLRVSPWVTLAYPGMIATLRAMITLWIPPPSTAAMTRANKIIGKHINASMALMVTILAMPPKYPEINPSETPMMEATPTDIKPTISAVLEP